jgi:hypothetical protein
MKHLKHLPLQVLLFRATPAGIHNAHPFRPLLIGLLASCACFATSDRTNETGGLANQEESISVRAVVDTFCRLARAGQIDRVSVKYAPWEVERSCRIRERDLLTGSHYAVDWEITAHREMAAEAAMKLADALDKQRRRLKKKDIAASELDFGLAAVFYAHEKQVLCLSVSKYPPAISINGEFIAANPYLVYPLTGLIPVDAHRGMFFYVLDEWASPPYKETIDGFRRIPGGPDPNTTLEWIRQKSGIQRSGSEQRE